ncbi:MAG: hypothetical protein MJZ71_04060 [Bacteroidales bacterium]|nr:hypothetical protein [Bacteroidales bacterium]
MSLIVGVEYCKTDANGRFKLPVAFIKQLDLSSDNRFFIRRSIYNAYLELFTYASFQEEVKKLQDKLNPYDPEAKRLYRRYIEGNMLELDSADRLNIPGSLRQDANIDKEIVVVGSGDFIEIWDSATYKNIDNDNFDYKAVAKALLGDTKEE